MHIRVRNRWTPELGSASGSNSGTTPIFLWALSSSPSSSSLFSRSTTSPEFKWTKQGLKELAPKLNSPNCPKPSFWSSNKWGFRLHVNLCAMCHQKSQHLWIKERQAWSDRFPESITDKIVYFSPPARWGLLDFITVVLLLRLLLLLILHLLLLLLPLLQLLLHHLCIHSHVHFRLANSSPSSSPTSARSGHCWTSTARVWTHWTPLDLNLGPSELSEHRWTSTWDPPSSVSTAGPQPGTLRAQRAPLDLNLGPSELSEHRWTSTVR